MYPSSKSNLVVLIEKAIQLMSSSEESCQNSAEIVEDPLSPPAQQNDENTLAEDTSPVIQQPIKVPCLSNINNEELVVDPLQFLAAEYALKKNEQMSQSLDSYCQPSFGMFSNWGQLHNLSNLISGPSVPSSSGESTLPHPRSIRRCQFEGCQKYAQGATKLCIAHGGGRRCTFPGCSKGARDRLYCAAHGGGRRCSVNHCSKSAVGGTAYCTAHGGGKRCQYPGCCKSSQSNTKYCVRHGGGKSCQFEGCTKVRYWIFDCCIH